MPRYFLELAYKGTQYSGFQVQHHTATIQSEVEKALKTLFPSGLAGVDGQGNPNPFTLTGSSRTDAGVHALQNFFHLDTAIPIPQQRLYNLNAILPPDIVVKHIYPVKMDAHCRFDALSRTYRYYIYQSKSPFLNDSAYYFPFKLDESLLQQAAGIISQHTDFTSFSKRNTQVKTFQCNILQSFWQKEDECLVYQVEANRFLRGMVRGLVGTMLKVGRGVWSLQDFEKILKAKDCTKADFSTPPHGLFLVAVKYPPGQFNLSNE